MRFEHNPTRDSGNIQEPTLTKFECVQELLGVVSAIDEYRALDHWGRIRILSKFASHFAKPTSITARSSLFDVIKMPSFSEVSWNHFFKGHNFDRLWMLQFDQWGTGGVPALYLNDPRLGPIVVDVLSLPLWAKTDDTAIIPADFDNDGTLITGWPIWCGVAPPAEEWKESSPDKTLAFIFFNQAGMKKWGVHYAAGGSWEDRAKTRSIEKHVLKHLREIGGEDCGTSVPQDAQPPTPPAQE
jgi:hypothetical protein